MDISKKGKGALKSLPDLRDVPFAAFSPTASTLRYDRGFGYYQRIFGKIAIEDQGSSSSCVGQAWSKMYEIIDFHTYKMVVNLSARDIYSRIYLPQGGAYGYKGASVLKTHGIATESSVKSYIGDQPPTEAYMRLQDNSPTAVKIAGLRKLNGYANIMSGIDEIATAILTRKACVFGVYLSNNGWQDADVRPPLPNEPIDGHFLVGVDITIRNGEKCIVFQNSWSDQWGDKGYGYLPESYFVSGNVFNGMAPVELNEYWQSIVDMKRVVKLEGSHDQYMLENGKKILIPDLSTRIYLRDVLKIIPDTDPELISKAELDTFVEAEPFSIEVMRVAKSAYPVLKDAFEPNQQV